ncbi:unnamed protein product, partial [Ectocarpus fasciculatus]
MFPLLPLLASCMAASPMATEATAGAGRFSISCCEAEFQSSFSLRPGGAVEPSRLASWSTTLFTPGVAVLPVTSLTVAVLALTEKGLPSPPTFSSARGCFAVTTPPGECLLESVEEHGS